jgi:quinol monooxygenase YgiN
VSAGEREDAIMNRSAVREIQGIGRFKFREGELEQFKRLSAQLMEIVRSKDTGTVQYEIYFNDDQSECIVLERYRDSEALVEHAGHLGDLGRAIPGLVSSELLGQPSDDVRAKLIGSGVRLFTPFLSL